MIGLEPPSFVVVVCSFGEDLSFEASEGFLRVVEVTLFIAGVAFSTADGSFLIAGFFFGFSLLASKDFSPNDL